MAMTKMFIASNLMYLILLRNSNEHITFILVSQFFFNKSTKYLFNLTSTTTFNLVLFQLPTVEFELKKNKNISEYPL